MTLDLTKPFAPSSSVLVIDSPMGAGKSTWAKRAMIGAAHAHDEALFSAPEGVVDIQPTRFVYIAPLLDLAKDVVRECHELEFEEPREDEHGKLRALKNLLRSGRNVATTHALFKNLDEEALRLITARGYVLIIDEQLEVAKDFKLTEWEVGLLLRNGSIEVDESTKRLRWIDPKAESRYDDVKALCNLGALTLWEDSVTIWELPAAILPVFKRIVVLTYLFRGSMMDAHLRANGIAYDVAAVKVDAEGNYRLVPEEQRNDRAIRRRFKALLEIVEDEKLNAIGTSPVGREGRSQPLSATWFRRGKDSNTETLRKNLDTFLRSRCRSSSDQAMWTAFKAQRNALAPQSFAKSFVPFNTQGTNAHRKRKHAAYLCNTFAHPTIVRYLEWRGVSIDGDLYALSALIQWLWRGCIRDGKPMVAYIPSERMRGLLRDWLNGKDLAPHRDIVEELSRVLKSPPQSIPEDGSGASRTWADGPEFERFDDFDDVEEYDDSEDNEQGDQRSDEQSDEQSDSKEPVGA